MVLDELALKIINEVRKLIHEDIIIINTDGIIIASTDPERTGTFHEGSLISLKERKTFTITVEDEKRLSGVKAGINLPIYFQNEIVGVIGITGDPDHISPFGEMLRRMTELLIRENYYTDQIDLHQRTLEAFVFDWIQNVEWDENFHERSHMLNIELNSQRQVIIFEWENQNILPIDTRQLIIDLTNRNKQDVFVRWGNNRIVVLMSIEDSRKDYYQLINDLYKIIRNRLNSPIAAGVGQQIIPDQLHKSYHQAVRALKVALKTSSIIFDLDLTIDIILQELSPEIKKTFIERTIEPILNEEDLFITIKEYINQNQSLKNTAQSLHIHINTLLYRLNKITELTKLNPKDIQDLFKLYIGTYLLDDSTKKHR
ncbi:CdaR family transcriptional regulator [Gottfriedia luciferensis]|uniref:CdaR family transcriptional regulator n=1 Tax=Gottfriedia luciferensis TaxID=178774 RepID=UPI000B4321A7|nr:sugar diacid recognition domain-containing protein [Gottfriedia luciferensis]